LQMLSVSATIVAWISLICLISQQSNGMWPYLVKLNHT